MLELGEAIVTLVFLVHVLSSWKIVGARRAGFVNPSCVHRYFYRLGFAKRYNRNHIFGVIKRPHWMESRCWPTLFFLGWLRGGG